MSKFDRYFLMKDADVIDYVREKLDYFPESDQLACKEIGDGNLNYVFRVVSIDSGRSIIVKQAGNTARISDDFVLSTDRNRIESEILVWEGQLAPGYVPEVYKYDEVMNCCVMDDLSDHVIMRQALMNHEIFPRFSDDISTFMVNTLLLTTDVVLDHKEKKELVKKYINPELCEITEDLVYTEPFNNYKSRNSVFEPNLEWVEKNFYQDQDLLLEVSKLKFDFMNNAQALIHGDLHTGSIFIRHDSTKVIDPEFAFYGPMGYDTGNVIANLIFAWANGNATIKNRDERDIYLNWLEATIQQTIDLFKVKFLNVFETRATEVLAKTKGFAEWYLRSVLRDTAAVCGLELSRRIIGMAKVKDITSISDPEARTTAERICLMAAKKFIMNRETFMTGTDFVAAFKSGAN